MALTPTSSSGGGGLASVTDGVHTVAAATSLDFTAGATVTDGGSGVAQVAITAAGTKQVPVRLTTPDATGNGYAALVAGANVRALVAGFLKDVVGDWWGQVRVPTDYASAGAIVVSVAANATSGVTVIGLASAPIANAEVYDTAPTAEADQNVTVPGTAYTRDDVTFTLTPTLAAGDDLLVRVRHNGTAAADTLAVDTLVFAVYLSYTAG